MSSCCSAMQGFDDDDINIVLLGKAGNGKSSTGNTILSRNVFPTSDSSLPMTKLASLNSSKCELTNSVINVVDTIGLMDPNGGDPLSSIAQAMSLCPNGFNAVIFVIRYGNTFTREEESCLLILKQHLGPTFLQDFGIVIMTFGNSFDLCSKYSSFSDWCRLEKHEDKFAQLLAECNYRCVLFYNKGKRFAELRKKCVAEMFKIIRTQIPRRYRCPKFDAATTTRKMILDKIGMPVLHKQIQQQISLLDEILQKNIKSDSFSFDHMTNRARELYKALDDLTDTPELKNLKIQIKLITDKIDYLKEEKDKKRRRDIQRQMKKDLRLIQNPPDKSPVDTANRKLIFAKIAHWLGTVFSLGLAADYLENEVFEKKIELEVEEKLYEKRVKRYAAAVERVLIQVNEKLYEEGEKRYAAAKERVLTQETSSTL